MSVNTNDIGVRKDIESELEFDPRVEAAAIGITVKNGIVTLTGHVPTFAQKLAAEAAVKRVKGVRAVAQEIEVRVPTDLRQDDDEIARRALEVLAWSVHAPKTGVKVKVSSGWVTLHGEADHAYQRDNAESAVRMLAGVTGITNSITVRPAPHPTAQEIQAKIRSAFHRSAEIDADKITVTVDGDEVLLTGAVGDWHERRLAENTAWAVPGVLRVVDHLTV